MNPRDPELDDKLLLLTRIDELSTVVAAMTRASRRARTFRLRVKVDQVKEAELINLLDSLTDDNDYLRALVIALGDETDNLNDRIAQDYERVVRVEVELLETIGKLKSLSEELGRLRDHRDSVVSELLEVQESRWMRLGRSLRIIRRPANSQKNHD